MKGSNPGYLLKSFLLYPKLQPKLVLTLLLFRGVSDISSAYNFLKFRSTIYIKSSTSLTVHAVTFSSQGSFPSAKYRFAHLFSSIFVFVFSLPDILSFFQQEKKIFFFVVFKYLVVVLFCRSVTWFVIFKGPSSTVGISIFYFLFFFDRAAYLEQLVIWSRFALLFCMKKLQNWFFHLGFFSFSLI